MWDNVAKRVWGTEKMMHILIAANPSYRHILVFPAGISLVIPDIDIEPISAPPPWRR